MHIKLEHHVAGRKCHSVFCGILLRRFALIRQKKRIPRTDNMTAAVRILLNLLDNPVNLVCVAVCTVGKITPLPAVYRAQTAGVIRPFIPDGTALFIQRADICIPLQHPEQFGDYAFEMDFFGGNNREAFPQIKTHLRTEKGYRAGAGKLTTLTEEQIVVDPERVRALSLKRNFLTDFPEIVFRMSNLEFLIIRRNQISELPESIGKFTKLKFFDCVRNEIKNIPEELGKISTLRSCNFDDNNILSIPERISGLENLTRMSLNFNMLSDIPKTIGDLKSLRRLDIRGNNLTELPKEICRLTGLVYLNLRGNNIKTIPEDIGNLSRLRYLDLSGNQIQYIPSHSPV
ncbi:hypothetical protein CHS0354_006844 [Potamilus streckersoni]|uniref:Leucine-rich repeat domain-containing protein n=1 Tax=Potamilus streckersoni TaxID=2493646 RepID=A0AAE0WB48_9BIVA|nr:hypothetical protein CHS0354_006844 [Potamilus streckersoni]